MDKKGKLSSVLFMLVMLMPLLGLLIMNFQLEAANNITGMAVKQVEWGPFSLAVGIISVTVIVVFSGYEIISSVKRKKTIDTINKDITEIEKTLDDLQKKR